MSLGALNLFDCKGGRCRGAYGGPARAVEKGLALVQILLLLLLRGEHSVECNGPRNLRPNNFTKKPIRPIYCLVSL